jgi:hypothetical protein
MGDSALLVSDGVCGPAPSCGVMGEIVVSLTVKCTPAIGLVDDRARADTGSDDRSSSVLKKRLPRIAQTKDWAWA